MPGHGPAGDRHLLATQAAYLRALRARVRDLYEAGLPIEEAWRQLAAVPGFEHYRFPGRLVHAIAPLYHAIAPLYEELAAEPRRLTGRW